MTTPTATNKTNHALSCRLCSTSFCSHDMLLLHLDIHLRQRCSICNIEYSTTLNDTQKNAKCIANHTFITSSTKSYEKLKCKYCSFTTIIENNLYHHSMKHQQPQSIPKPTSSNINTTNDTKIYSYPITKHPCQHCDYIARSATTLKKHLRTHTNERPYKCDQCDQTFTVQCNLKAHIRSIHENKRNYICKYCGQAYNSSYPLRQHENGHTQNKEYKCRQGCDQGFINANRRKRHEKNEHIGWPCRYCIKLFLTEGDKRRHELEDHEQLRQRLGKQERVLMCLHKCKKCELRFKREEECKEHEKKCGVVGIGDVVAGGRKRMREYESELSDDEVVIEPPQKKRKESVVDGV